MKIVLLITGPGSAGKTTVAQMLSEQSDFVYLDGDHEDTEFFPDGNQWLPENTELLKKAHEKILRKTKEVVSQGKSVVIDYIIFGQYLEFIRSLRNEFCNDFSVKVLFPSKEELVKRDTDRECWTTGAERIEAVYAEFESIKNEIHSKNFLNTTEQSPEETVATILSQLT